MGKLPASQYLLPPVRPSAGLKEYKDYVEAYKLWETEVKKRKEAVKTELLAKKSGGSVSTTAKDFAEQTKVKVRYFKDGTWTSCEVDLHRFLRRTVISGDGERYVQLAESDPMALEGVRNAPAFIKDIAPVEKKKSAQPVLSDADKAKAEAAKKATRRAKNRRRRANKNRRVLDEKKKTAQAAAALAQAEAARAKAEAAKARAQARVVPGKSFAQVAKPATVKVPTQRVTQQAEVFRPPPPPPSLAARTRTGTPTSMATAQAEASRLAFLGLGDTSGIRVINREERQRDLDSRDQDAGF